MQTLPGRADKDRLENLYDTLMTKPVGAKRDRWAWLVLPCLPAVIAAFPQPALA